MTSYYANPVAAGHPEVSMREFDCSGVVVMMMMMGRRRLAW